jgi:hypothetical protein
VCALRLAVGVHELTAASVYMNSLMAALNMRPLFAAGRSHTGRTQESYALHVPANGRLAVHVERETESQSDTVVDLPRSNLNKVLHVV